MLGDDGAGSFAEGDAIVERRISPRRESLYVPLRNYDMRHMGSSTYPGI